MDRRTRNTFISYTTTTFKQHSITFENKTPQEKKNKQQKNRK
jgi:hypothetical protein